VHVLEVYIKIFYDNLYFDDDRNFENLSYVENLEREKKQKLYVKYDTESWNDRIDGLIYMDSNFFNELKQILFLLLDELEISRNALNDLDYSDLNSQSQGSVCFDAAEFAGALRKLH